MNTIGSIQNYGAGPVGAPLAMPPAMSTGVKSAEFKDVLVQSIQQVNTMQLDADKAVETLFTGGNANPAEVLTAVQKADLAFRTMMQIRNKLMAAYEEVKSIRV